ncbi:MAG: ROK family protein [Clostridia bacterium]|nr:ROK family protein [Clostridia bacterium]
MACCRKKKYYVGIDLGGTFIKGGIVDGNGEILALDKTPTESEKGSEKVAENISTLALSLLEKAQIAKTDVVGLGMGVPGMIDSKNGVVTYSNNLNFKEFDIAGSVSKRTGLAVKIANDANVAALGEAKFGAAKGCQNMVMITLGTGVGGGVVAEGKMLEGNRSAGAELGHTVIVRGGEQCTCGRKGCFEAYSSATALIRDTKRAMEAHKDSKMWETYTLETVSGKTAFDYKDSDPYAKEVVQNYVEHLAVGLTNFANIFRPEVILLGGGVCAQGDNLIKPVQEILDAELFGGDMGPSVPVKIAQLENSAGVLGAAALWL